jgi:asparaginyl-tRNA synthetase
MKRSEIKLLLEKGEVKAGVNVKGWIRTNRGSKNVSFIAVNDGSTIKNLQIVIDNDSFDEHTLKRLTTGACASFTGDLIESQGAGQSVEMQCKSVTILGDADPEDVKLTILQPKRHSLEKLREQAHLRPRTNTFGAVFRVRNALAFAIHKYFNEKGYVYMHTPIITGSDAEGAGEMFQVTTLDLKSIPLNESKEVDFEQDFFGKATNLTVSGQLEAELGALALGKVYTFGPTFRAENSNTTRHVAEFWMIEPEIAFADLIENMDVAEDFLKYVIQYAMDTCPDDLSFLHKREVDSEKQKKAEDRNELPLLERLKFVLENEFERLTYTEAFDILRNSKPNKKKKFNYPIDEWGVDLHSEHERYLVEKKFKKPVIIRDYPAKIKAFYMRLNDDGKTVGAMDILFPGIGEIVGGSQREERLDYLKKGIERFDIPEDHVWWYLETRKLGTAPHSGFGLGFERLVMFVTGMTNIRDVIPFPRTPRSAEF